MNYFPSHKDQVVARVDPYHPTPDGCAAASAHTGDWAREWLYESGTAVSRTLMIESEIVKRQIVNRTSVILYMGSSQHLSRQLYI